jgi:3-hydroxybutyryl-CoA dehydrogenase
MALVEVISSSATGDEWTRAAFQLAAQLGKTAVAAPDRPGFLVNRLMRPFYAEALRLVEEEVAHPAAVDRVMEGAGFPMGPFRLMDLVGIDVNLAVTDAVYAQTFGEARYRPHPLQVMMRDLGWLGRKSGRGFYDYGAAPAPASHENPPDPVQPLPGGLVKGSPAFQAAWRALGLAGRLASEPPEPGLLRFMVDPEAGSEPPREAGPDTLVVLDGTRQHVGALSARWRRPVVGFDPALVLAGGRVMTVAGGGEDAAARIFAPMAVVPVEDAYGQVFSRVVAVLVDEALRFRPRLDRDRVNQAVHLGVNQPRGPFEWLTVLGAARVLGLLEALSRVGGDRYLPSEDLIRAVERQAATDA